MEHSILQTVLWSYLICINIITIAVYGIDNRSAVRGKWRIRVSTLLGLAAAGGSVGALLGIPGIIIAWLVNVDKMPQVKSDALKFAIIGFVIWIVLQFIFGMIVFGTISAAMYGLMNSVDMGSYNYGYHGSW